MALTQVRAKLGNTWTALTYNNATGRYEGVLTPPGTSIHQPGGYYSVTVEAVNDSGNTASISGTQLPSLRLVVRETISPVVTLVSPAQGYLTTSAPVVVFSAVDEAGGSGIDPDSAAASVDGVPAACTVAEAGGGYTVTVACSGLSDGPHTVTVSISDYDGNDAFAAAAYTVDTAAPVLVLRKPDLHRVVDDDRVEIAGEAWDVTAPMVTVTVAGKPVDSEDGRFSATVPLKVGENTITVTATDGAGLRSTAEVYMIRLVTDRAAADIASLTALMAKPLESWTAEELAWFNDAGQRGAYNAADLNRVGAAVRYLSGEMERRGLLIGTAPKTDWSEKDAPTVGQMEAYLSDVEAVRTAQGLEMPEIPETVRRLTVEGANRIEAALVAVDRILPLQWAWTAGEVFCGEG